MTFNKRTRTVSGRVDHDAYDVLKWHSALSGYGVSTEIRDYLHMRAAQISADNPAHDPSKVKPRTADDIVLPDFDELVGRLPDVDEPPGDPVEQFCAVLAEALDVPIEDVRASAIYDPTEGVVRAEVAGHPYVSTPTPPTED